MTCRHSAWYGNDEIESYKDGGGGSEIAYDREQGVRKEVSRADVIFLRTCSPSESDLGRAGGRNVQIASRECATLPISLTDITKLHLLSATPR